MMKCIFLNYQALKTEIILGRKMTNLISKSVQDCIGWTQEMAFSCRKTQIR